MMGRSSWAAGSSAPLPPFGEIFAPPSLFVACPKRNEILLLKSPLSLYHREGVPGGEACRRRLAGTTEWLVASCLPAGPSASPQKQSGKDQPRRGYRMVLKTRLLSRKDSDEITGLSGYLDRRTNALPGLFLRFVVNELLSLVSNQGWLFLLGQVLCVELRRASSLSNSHRKDEAKTGSSFPSRGTGDRTRFLSAAEDRFVPDSTHSLYQSGNVEKFHGRESRVKKGIFLAPKDYKLELDDGSDVMKHKGAGKDYVTEEWFEEQYNDPCSDSNWSKSVWHSRKLPMKRSFTKRGLLIMWIQRLQVVRFPQAFLTEQATLQTGINRPKGYPVSNGNPRVRTRGQPMAIDRRNRTAQ
ncbi:unnamed protein product [Cochlearia groenlandica]